MVSEVSKALKTYEALPLAGKRLFREELGLVRPQQAKTRARRSKVEPTEAGPVRTLRATRKRSDTSISVTGTPRADSIVRLEQPTA